MGKLLKALGLVLLLGSPAAAQTAADNTTYYVAINEAGASNTACDGRAPTYVAEGNCPWKDFTTETMRQILMGRKGTILEVRSGTYTLTAFAHEIIISGTGTSAAERTILRGYQDERPIFNGNAATQQIIRLTGNWTGLEGVEVTNSGGYNVEFRGATNAYAIDNVIRGSGSDSLKIDGGAEYIDILHNDFSGYTSQGIDITGSSEITIKHNTFHDAGDADSFGLGMKMGTSSVDIFHNTFGPNSRGITLGGTSASHPESYEVYDAVVGSNTFNTTWSAIQLYSCLSCMIRNNTITAQSGFYITNVADMGPSGCNNDGAECDETDDLKVVFNRFTLSTAYVHNAFWTTVPTIEWLGNTYCVTGTPTYLVNSVSKTSAEWVALTDEEVGACP